MGGGGELEGEGGKMNANIQRRERLRKETKVYWANEYTLANGRFALTVEPDNEALRQRMVGVEAMRAAGEATVPTTIALERATNPFMRADSVEMLAERRHAKDNFSFRKGGDSNAHAFRTRGRRQ